MAPMYATLTIEYSEEKLSEIIRKKYTNNIKKKEFNHIYQPLDSGRIWHKVNF